MRINVISSALCADRLEDSDRRILKNEIWCEEFAALVEDAWKQVRELKRQRDALDRLFPAKVYQHEREFSAEVMNLAVKIYEQVFEVTA